MAPRPKWEEACEALFESAIATRRLIETGVQDLKEAVEDYQDDPATIRRRAVTQLKERASTLPSQVISGVKELRNNPLKYGRQLTTLLPFAASKSPATDAALPLEEQWRNQGDDHLPDGYREYLEAQEKSCPTCLRLASNVRIPLSELRSSAEEDRCWVCEVFWKGLLNDEARIRLISQEDQPFALERLEVYVRLWRAFELVLQWRHKDTEDSWLIPLEFYIPDNRAGSHGLWPPFLTRRHLPSDPRNDQCLADINHWIEDCVNDHLICRQGFSRRPLLPTRVLEIDSSSSPPILRLIETNGAKGAYTALSHCWGNMKPLKTTLASYGTHLEGISWSQLSKSFQDSVIVTMSLGVKHLWIDSICIIQDDSADWTAESSKMGSIYEKAYVVIAASAVSSGEHGCLDERYGYNEIEVIPAESSKISDSSASRSRRVFTRYFMPDHGSFVRQWEHPKYDPDLPLLSRAWAFQERMLATRVLHFTDFEIIWECKTRLDCECGQNGERNPGGLKHEYAHALRSGNALLLDRHAVWGEMLEEYTSRNLTYAEDKLVALSATVSRIAHFSLGQYLAGMWRHMLIDLLLWTRVSRNYPKPRSGKYVAPTWSWASVDGQILDNPEKLPSRDLLHWVKRRESIAQDHWYVIEEVHCQLGSENPYGQVVAGHLKLHAARTAEAIFRTPAERRHVIERTIEASAAADDEEEAEPKLSTLVLAQDFIPDVDLTSGSDALGDGSFVLCIFFQAKASGNHYALVLKPCTRVEGSYERIGVLNIEERWYTGCEKRTIRII